MIDTPKTLAEARRALTEVRAHLHAMLEKLEDARTYKPADLLRMRIDQIENAARQADYLVGHTVETIAPLRSLPSMEPMEDGRTVVRFAGGEMAILGDAPYEHDPEPMPAPEPIPEADFGLDPEVEKAIRRYAAMAAGCGAKLEYQGGRVDDSPDAAQIIVGFRKIEADG